MAMALGWLLLCYLIGGIPFGYLVGRMKGKNLFHEGSGNIGATNAGRVLGRKYGFLVFFLDYLKGALPVAYALPATVALDPGAATALGAPDALRVGSAMFAFLGHLFPVYLKFRGGKGVATGAGAVFVLVPVPAVFALVTWFLVLLASRYVSAASITAVAVLMVTHLFITPAAFVYPACIVTGFCLLASIIVVVKHRSNLRRLQAGTENQVRVERIADPLLRSIHVFAMGVWFGGAAFFNYGTALPIFDSFKRVVNEGPSDRTAYQTIIPADASQAQKDALASALAGSAVGPVFPRYFAMQAVCALAAVISAWSWRKHGPRHYRRLVLLLFAAGTVAIGWPLSEEVSRLRLLRFDPNPEIAAGAKLAFGPWHFASLLLSFVTTTLAGIGLLMAASLPNRPGDGQSVDSRDAGNAKAP